MWNVISGNRLIDRKRKQEAQRKHVAALNNIKSLVNNSTPKQYTFLFSRPKARQLKLQRQMSIRLHNDILLNKMMRSSSEISSKHEDLGMRTLNTIYKTRVDKQIDQGNQKLVLRLQRARSTYSKARQTGKDYIKYRSNMANSRMDPFYDLQYQSSAVVGSRKGSRPFSAKN